jgi:hypothetical protein
MKWLGWLAAIVIGVYVFLFYFAFPTYTHRFRLTFQVESDGVVREGSSVITVEDFDMGWYPLAGKRWNRFSRGPVPWIDLGSHGLLMASMIPVKDRYSPPGPYDTYSAGELSFVAFFGADRSSPMLATDTVQKIRSEKGVRQLPNNRLPTFIWLPNPLDPDSAKVVRPSEFTQVIGGGTRLVSMSVEITTDRPDRSIYDRLTWLSEHTREQRGAATSPQLSETFKLTAQHILGDP